MEEEDDENDDHYLRALVGEGAAMGRPMIVEEVEAEEGRPMMVGVVEAEEGRQKLQEHLELVVVHLGEGVGQASVRHCVLLEALVVVEVEVVAQKMERLDSALAEAEAVGWKPEVWHGPGMSRERLAGMLAELLFLAVEAGAQAYSSRCGMEEEPRILA